MVDQEKICGTDMSLVVDEKQTRVDNDWTSGGREFQRIDAAKAKLFIDLWDELTVLQDRQMQPK